MRDWLDIKLPVSIFLSGGLDSSSVAAVARLGTNEPFADAANLLLAQSLGGREGHAINWRLMVADYSPLGLIGDALKEWAYLDTFDMLSPKYDLHVRSGTFHQWAEDAGYTDIETEYSGHGVTLRAIKPRD